MDKKKLQQIQNLLQYNFVDQNTLKKAFTHSSAADKRVESNERLEFLGDSVLGLIVCEAIYQRFPNYLEGDMTKIKSLLVSRKICSKVAAELGLSELIKIGPGMEKSKSLKGSVAAGVIEAIIAAIYIDGGFAPAREFVIRSFGHWITQADAKAHHENFKSLLQQHTQQALNTTVVYEILDEKGPDHDKCFEYAVVINGHRYPSAWGTNKKESQQAAAYNALVELGVIKPKDK